MYRLVIASLTATGLMGLPAAAFAADLAPAAAPAPMYTKAPSSAWSWTGLYGGLNVGASFDRDSDTYTIGPMSQSFTENGTGVIGGGQLGYNWQAGNFVLGVEGDIAYRHRANSSTPLGMIDQVNVSDTQNWVATVRPRVGFTVGNALIYGTGGWAIGEVDHSYRQIRITTGQNTFASDSVTRSGWTAGGGVEWAFFDKWSAGVEYLHVDLGKDTLQTPAQNVGGLIFAPSQTMFKDTSEIVRAKLNYHF